MLKDADSKSFHAIYIVCGFTDLRYGMDRLAAIIEHQYHLDVFVPNTLFLFCGRRANRIKGLLWEGDGSGTENLNFIKQKQNKVKIFSKSEFDMVGQLFR